MGLEGGSNCQHVYTYVRTCCNNHAYHRQCTYTHNNYPTHTHTSTHLQLMYVHPHIPKCSQTHTPTSKYIHTHTLLRPHIPTGPHICILQPTKLSMYLRSSEWINWISLGDISMNRSLRLRARYSSICTYGKGSKHQWGGCIHRDAFVALWDCQHSISVAATPQCSVTTVTHSGTTPHQQNKGSSAHTAKVHPAPTARTLACQVLHNL